MLCKVCNEDLHENNFYLKDKETNRRSTICKECYNYRRNKTRNHIIKQELKKIPVIEMIPNTCNTNNTINTVEVKQEIKKIPVEVIKNIPVKTENKKFPVEEKQEIKKIPSSMEDVMTMVNNKKYNNPNNRNFDILFYTAFVGIKSLLGNKKKPVIRIKQEINTKCSKDSYGQAMFYDENYYGYDRIK